jgi:hypothetical protein
MPQSYLVVDKRYRGYPCQDGTNPSNFSHVFLQQCHPRLCVQVREYSNRIDEPSAMASMAHGIAAAGARYKLNAAGKGFLEPLLANTEGLDSDSGKISVKCCHYFWGNLNLGFYLQPFIEESEDESVEIEKQGPLAKLKTTASKFVYHFQAIAIAHSDT